ncbi:unnamed protein product [Nippostrongylus brasiliensis]|uniref:GLOBIN domain-containing protein n=1 Tax=Nippostrongylus brasiliensis TaxID=27835 RepID=A0A0N4XIR7_NIPBR|nr:unnamed protein product [Nippostrongylus brasiliensis]
MLCEKIWNTTAEQMLLMGGPRVAKLFEVLQSKRKRSSFGFSYAAQFQNFVRAIAVHPSKMAEVKSAFPDIQEVSVTSLNYLPPLLARAT